ncbi:hypothetical protein ACP3P8_16795 [Pseudomonas aeruginosa]
MIWAENDIYWIAFDKTGSSRLSYYVLSWPTALLIVRSFESLPQVEEIEVFLENLFASWYENSTLRRAFKAFARYLWFRFANLEGCLPPASTLISMILASYQLRNTVIWDFATR